MTVACYFKQKPVNYAQNTLFPEATGEFSRQSSVREQKLDSNIENRPYMYTRHYIRPSDNRTVYMCSIL